MKVDHGGFQFGTGAGNPRRDEYGNLYGIKRATKDTGVFNADAPAVVGVFFIHFTLYSLSSSFMLLFVYMYRIMIL